MLTKKTITQLSAAKYSLALLVFSLANFTLWATDINSNDVTAGLDNKIAQKSFFKQVSEDKLSVYASMGILNVKAQEYVFGDIWGNNQPRMLSHLIWNTKRIPLFKIGFGYQFNPIVSFSLAAWTVKPQSKSHMDDYDWMNIFNNLDVRTNWSSHDNVRLKNSGFDAQLKFRLNPNNPKYRINLLAGLKRNRFSWVAPEYGYFEYDKSFILPKPLYGYWGDADKAGITYQQSYKLPYLGISTGLTYKKIELDATWKLSKFGTVRTLDIHHARDIRFREIPTRRPFYQELNLNIAYKIKPKLRLFAQFDGAFVPKVITNNTIAGPNFFGNYEVNENKEGSGMRNLYKSFSLGLKYSM